MSWQVEAWARKQRTGDPVTKAILVALADWANPRGEECWPSLRLVAAEVEVSVRTVQRHIARLEELGFVKRSERLRPDGKGQTSNLFEWPLYVAGLAASSATPVTDCHPTPLTDCHGPGDTAVTPRNNQVNLPFEDKSSQGARARGTARSSRGERLAEAWHPEPLAGRAGEVADYYGDAWVEIELEKFRCHWRSESGARAAKLDWQAAWQNWVLKADEFTARSRRVEPAAQRVEHSIAVVRFEKHGEADQCADLRRMWSEVLASKINPATYSRWIDPCRLSIDHGRAVIEAEKPFSAAYIRDNLAGFLLPTVRSLLGENASVKVLPA